MVESNCNTFVKHRHGQTWAHDEHFAKLSEQQKARSRFVTTANNNYGRADRFFKQSDKNYTVTRNLSILAGSIRGGVP
jgi:hypothetical protein